MASNSSYDAFAAVDKKVAKAVIGSDGAASWQEFHRDQTKNSSGSHAAISSSSSVAPNLPLKRADRLAGFSSIQDERKMEQQIRAQAGDAAVGEGYTVFKRKRTAEDAAEAKRIKLIRKRTLPDDKTYYIKAETFAGWKEDYIFTTRDRGTGYYWDGMDSVKRLDGIELPPTTTRGTENQTDISTTQTTEPNEEAETGEETQKKRKKKKKKNGSNSLVEDIPQDPRASAHMEAVALAMRRRKEVLHGTTAAVSSQQDSSASSSSKKESEEGWHEATDPLSGKTYYFKRSTGERQWEKPVSVLVPASTSTSSSSADSGNVPSNTSLPDGWESTMDSSSGKVYYYHSSSGKTSWDKPTV